MASAIRSFVHEETEIEAPRVIISRATSSSVLIWPGVVTTGVLDESEHFVVLPDALALTHERAVALGRRAPTRPRGNWQEIDFGSAR